MILLRTLFSMVSATASLLPFRFPRRLATASTMSVFAISSSKPMCSAERDRTRISERPLVFRSAGAVVPAQPARHLLRLHVHRLEVELAVEVHDDDAVAALFALVIMDLSRRLRPHGSRPPDTPRCASASPSPCPQETFAGSPRRPRLDSPTPRTSAVQGASDRRASTEWRRSS